MTASNVELLHRDAAKPTPSSGLKIAPDSPARFINRELSWLDFNGRVMEEAANPRHPLLERLRFLSISGSNLDEFYSVRVAGLMGQAKAGVTAPSPDGRTPAQQLQAIRAQVQTLVAEQQRLWHELRRELHEAGLVVLDRNALAHNALSAEDHRWLESWFMERVFPVLTPLAIDPAHPFPFIPNMGLVLALKLERQDVGRIMEALVPLPAGPDGGSGRAIRFVLLEHLVVHCLDRLFPHCKVHGKGMFRLIRDTDVE